MSSRPNAFALLQAFESLLQLFDARSRYEEFCVPMCMLPATISNNVSGTDLSIGADTSLNAIVEVRRTPLSRNGRCYDSDQHSGNGKREFVRLLFLKMH